MFFVVLYRSLGIYFYKSLILLSILVKIRQLVAMGKGRRSVFLKKWDTVFLLIAYQRVKLNADCKKVLFHGILSIYINVSIYLFMSQR